MSNRRQGFTLVEVLIAAGIAVAIGVLSFVNLVNYRRQADLTNTTRQVVALLRQAQSNSMAQKNASTWGVHFDNTTSTAGFYDLFYTSGGTYASGTVADHYPLLSDVCFSSSSIAQGATLDVTFSTVTGSPSTSTAITLQLMQGGGCGTAGSPGTPASVVRNSSGKIFFDDFNRSTL